MPTIKSKQRKGEKLWQEITPWFLLRPLSHRDIRIPLLRGIPEREPGRFRE